MPNVQARRLRRDATDAERRLWSALRHHRLAGYKFRRQHPLEGHILDFACIAHRLAIEADGGQHTDETDATRTRRIEALGWRIVRFWNNDILSNTEGVVLTILAALREGPSPSRAKRAGPSLSRKRERG